jgi:glycosyltransferase involved in cell wall biosynthesis
MKVLIVNNMAPFLWGGAEELAVHLQRNVEQAGHQAELLRIPFRWEPAHHIPSQMMMVRWLEVWNVDRVIALKFPAYLICHPHKTLWLLHQYRQAYDLLEAGQSNLPPGPAGEELRRLIVAADAEALAESRRVFTNSEVTRERLRKYNGFEKATVLLPPLNDPQLFGGGQAGGYVFAGGRVNAMKRQHLLVQALAHTDPSVRLVIGGPPDSEHDAQRLRALAETLGVQDRLTLDLRFLPRELYASYVNGASAVAYLPFDEDSLGYVAMEAATAGKALITTSDSGGILGLAKHGETGWVCDPLPQALAEAMSALGADSERATRLGRGARELWASMGVRWDETVETLLS